MFDLPRSKQVRWLVDCDSFYASCEAFLNPQLRGLPICVGQDVVIACSYEAKAYGIKVGTPAREAKKVLPSTAVFLPRRMWEYGKISNRLMTYLRQKCLQVEEFSIDEAFFEITWYDLRYKMSLERIAYLMKKDIKKKIWISVSIGLAPTRHLAKIFAELNKPFGECVAIHNHDIDTILGSVPLKNIPNIWPKTQKKLAYRCITALDFKQLPYEYVRQLLGKNGITIRLELNAINAKSFAKKDKQRGINRTRSFHPNFTNRKECVRWHLLRNIERAIEHLLDMKMKTKYIKIHFRTKKFHKFWYDIALPHHVDDHMEIVRICRKLFEQCPFDETRYRTTGVYLGELTSAYSSQWSLFDYPQESERTRKHLVQKKLTTTIYNLNKKYGRGTVHVGTASPSKTTRWFNIMIVW